MTRGIKNDLVDFARYTKKDQETGCWIWTSYKYPNGYSKFCTNGVYMSGHKASYMFMYGDIPKGKEINHKCLRKDCVNPDHLEAVSHSENKLYSSRKRIHCRNGHELTPENVYIRNRGDRDCRMCRRISLNKYRVKKAIKEGLISV